MKKFDINDPSIIEAIDNCSSWARFTQSVDTFFLCGGKRSPGLDGVRAVAIVLILLRHTYDRPLLHVYGQASIGSLIPMWLQYLMSFGWVGVHLFFVLSGFLIGGIIYDKLRSDNFSLGRFYLNRTLRILPASYLYLLILGWPILGVNWQTFLNFTYLTNYLGGGFGSTGHFWSLNVEEHFYLVFPVCFILLYGLTKGGLRSTLGLLVALILVFWIARYFVCENPIGWLMSKDIYTASHWQIDFFLLGIIGAIACHHKLIPRHPICTLILWSTPLTYMLLSFLTAKTTGSCLLNQDARAFGWLFPLYGLWAFIFVVGAHTQSDIAIKPLVNRWLRWIAVLSYSIYIYHLIVIYFVITRGGSMILSLSKWMQDWPVVFAVIMFTIVLGISATVAGMVFSFIERPFLLLRKKIPSSRCLPGRSS